MENQAKLIKALATKLKAEEKVLSRIISTFTSAGILTKHQKFTKNYGNLEKAIESATLK